MSLAYVNLCLKKFFQNFYWRHKLKSSLSIPKKLKFFFEKFCLCHFLESYNGKSRLQHKFSKKKFFLNNPNAQRKLRKPKKRSLKAHSHFYVAELRAAKIAIKLQQLLPSCSVATRWYASLSVTGNSKHI